MRRRKPYDVVVVGAGMVGMALALALAKAGFDVALIESRAPRPWRAEDEVDPRVVALAPSSLGFFRRLDVWKEIAAARACAYRCMRVWDALAPGELAFDAVEQDRVALGYIVENSLIQHVLWFALQAQPAVTLHCPARVMATEVDAGLRTLILEDAGRVSAHLVVAADGADSPLRDLVGIDTSDRAYGQCAIVAHVATQYAHEHTAWQRFLPGATLAFLPLADGRSSIVWSLPDGEATRLRVLDDAAFCSALGAAFDFRLGTIETATPRATFPLRLKLAQRYLAPYFALIGDAAHSVHPLAGQGVNLGLRDASELLAVLTQARASGRDFAATANLRRYERRRRSDNVLAAHAFDAIQRVFGSESASLATLRGAGLALVNRVEPFRRLFADKAAGGI